MKTLENIFELVLLVPVVLIAGFAAMWPLWVSIAAIAFIANAF